LGAVDEFHEALGDLVTVDAAQVAEWIDGPLDVLAAHAARGGRLGRRMSSAIRRLRADLTEGLVGRTLRVGWVHGDYTAGNVLVDDAGTAVTGVIDWGR